MDDMDDVVKEFLVESYENLDGVERDLVALEDNPSDPALLANIFRTIHTIKGTCGFLGYGKLEAITHVGENLLSRLRDGELTLCSDVASVLLEQVDAVREILSSIEQTGLEGDGVYDGLVGRLERVLAGEPLEPSGPPRGSQETAVSGPEAEPRQEQAEDEVRPLSAEPLGDTQEDALQLPSEMLETPDAIGARQPPQLSAEPARDDGVALRPSLETSSTAGAPDARTASRHAAHVVESTVRVHVDLLDRLMNLVGELVLARNQILRIADDSRDPSLVATTQRLNQVTSELQEGVMTTRMQPIRNVTSKLPRVVRDLARGGRKRVRVEMEGEETGLDKTLIEAIKDPLTHLIRNAVDHGIEGPEQRAAAGKDPEGTLRLRAYHEGGQVNIELSDDGAGIDPVKLAAKAVERRLISPERAGGMSDRQALNLIFLPGLTTARTVTNVSGRGVGMDVVKTNVERIGGTIDISTALGEGTTFKVKIPLTLAIVPALFVRAADQRYAIPQVNLLELVRLDDTTCEIETIQGAPVFLLRDRLLPILYLPEELELGGGAAEALEGGVRHIVVLQADDQRFGLVVDDVQDTEEIVVKPLGEHVKEVGAFAGATIMGDGQVALILDVVGLASRGGIAGRMEDGDLPAAVGDSLMAIDESTSLLIANGEDRVCAIPLDRVVRLEEVSADLVEVVGGQRVVQYRDSILPLIPIDAWPANVADLDALQVVVFEYGGTLVGVVVRQIVDIMTEHIEVRPVGVRVGVAGTAIVGERVVEVIDLDGLADQRGLAQGVGGPLLEAAG